MAIPNLYLIYIQFSIVHVFFIHSLSFLFFAFVCLFGFFWWGGGGHLNKINLGYK